MDAKPPVHVELDWLSGFRFRGRAGDLETAIDGDGKAGPSPMTLLLLALAGCTGSDVADILSKGRQDLRGLRIEVRGERRQEPPHRYVRIRLVFHVAGPVAPAKAERAVALSFEKYCSVLHSLKDDLQVEWEVRQDGDAGVEWKVRQDRDAGEASG